MAQLSFCMKNLVKNLSKLSDWSFIDSKIFKLVNLLLGHNGIRIGDVGQPNTLVSFGVGMYTKQTFFVDLVSDIPVVAFFLLST